MPYVKHSCASHPEFLCDGDGDISISAAKADILSSAGKEMCVLRFGGSSCVVSWAVSVEEELLGSMVSVSSCPLLVSGEGDSC